MSDFDKEAEREKLRERFAEDEEKRETTEQMSELLLQGATMTDTHCDSCGNPLFRYDGQTFCPTCQRTATDGATEEQAAIEGDTPASGEPAPASTEGQQTAAEQPTQPNENTQPPRNTVEGQSAEPTRDRRASPTRTGDTKNARKPQSETARPTSGADDLAATEASLARTLRELSSAAEELDDLGRTREHLAAAHEAAEALDAVRTARK
ncbi:Sjogren's syndrome/scleroderma autoantigen 1 family protein [Halococcus sediminicola]|uniref:Sjogren's syndrome/scleroderma autoantigen 1 family protein n=1 Tax=Halococcus sediminicola TaxID=1264579 RepID=UPI000678A195|nr:Sjogren's syndrome/scleroderma autoantigen 1 family protein [Halococcus sediminicola]